ncbi:MAG TPA: hypothetical protein VK154_01190 [Chitinophagales bacterium]|nr:hypothetical protein [Chitinophagales bacterium]
MYQFYQGVWNQIASEERLKTRWAKRLFVLTEEKINDELEKEESRLGKEGYSTGTICAFLEIAPLYLEREAIKRFIWNHSELHEPLSVVLQLEIVDDVEHIAIGDRPHITYKELEDLKRLLIHEEAEHIEDNNFFPDNPIDSSSEKAKAIKEKTILMMANRILGKDVINPEHENSLDHEGPKKQPISPEQFALGVKILSKFTEKGVYKFADIVLSIVAGMGVVKARGVLDALKAAYASFHMTAEEPVADQLSDLKEVKEFDFDKFMEDTYTEEAMPKVKQLDGEDAKVSTEEEQADIMEGPNDNAAARNKQGFVFTPRGLKVRIPPEVVQIYTDRLHPNYTAIEVLKITEAVDDIPSSIGLSVGVFAFLTNLPPLQIALYVGLATLAGEFITTFGLVQLIPVWLLTVQSYVRRFGFFTIATILTGLLTVGWVGTLFYFIGHYFASIIFFYGVDYWLMKKAHTETGLTMTASERNFFNAYQLCAASMGVTTNLEMDENEKKKLAGQA